MGHGNEEASKEEIELQVLKAGRRRRRGKRERVEWFSRVGLRELQVEANRPCHVVHS